MLLSNDLHKLRLRSWSECILLLEALLWLTVMRIAIVLLPFRRISRMLGMVTASEAPMPGSELMEDATRICWAVSTAASRTPWDSTCLTQALAASALLKRKAIPTTLYLGVAKEAVSGGLTAHAWLRCGDAILLGAASAPQFAVVASFALLP